jgi:hypothetical protein
MGHYGAHFEFTRINIAPTILRKKIEDAPDVRQQCRSCGVAVMIVIGGFSSVGPFVYD